MLEIRTDLALEAKELFEERAGKTTKLSGVKATDYERVGFSVTAVEILDEEGAKALSKPVGDYRTVSLGDSIVFDSGEQGRAAECLSRELVTLFPKKLSPKAPVLVALLGNEDITPDAVGSETFKNLLISRPLCEGAAGFEEFRPVSAIMPGVYGTTGIESAEAVKSAAKSVGAELVIAVDALAARSFTRLCKSVQLSNSGIAPGSGVGNHRSAIDTQSIGVPVIAIGIPTVIDAATMAADLTGRDDDNIKNSRGMIVTVSDIDRRVSVFGRLVGHSVSMALNPRVDSDLISALMG